MLMAVKPVCLCNDCFASCYDLLIEYRPLIILDETVVTFSIYTIRTGRFVVSVVERIEQQCFQALFGSEHPQSMNVVVIRGILKMSATWCRTAQKELASLLIDVLDARAALCRIMFIERSIGLPDPSVTYIWHI